MITEKDVLDLFEKLQKSGLSEDENQFNIKIIKYFIQELEIILSKFNQNKHTKRIERLRLFQFDFEKSLTPEDSEPKNYLEPRIHNLFMVINESLSKEELSKLLLEAKELLKEYTN